MNEDRNMRTQLFIGKHCQFVMPIQAAGTETG